MRILIASFILAAVFGGTAHAADAAGTPVTASEIRTFMPAVLPKLTPEEQAAFGKAMQEATSEEALASILTTYAIVVQQRGVKLPHPVAAGPTPAPTATGVAAAPAAGDPEARVPTTIDPSWSVQQDDAGRIEEITRRVDRQMVRTSYDRHGARLREERFPVDRNADPSSGDPQSIRVDRAWTANQRLQRLTIGTLTYEFPVAVLPNHPLYNAKQVIVWVDPANQLKGARSATLLPATEPDTSTAFVGGWRAWNARGKEIEFGQMEHGARTGPWIERTFADTSDSGDPIAEAKGTYIAGKKSGTWIVKVSDEHPEVAQAVAAAQKSNRVLVGQSEGFRIEQIWEAGTLVKENRNF